MMSMQNYDSYRQAEDYFFRSICLKCLDLGDGAMTYMTGGAKLNFLALLA